MIFDRLFVAAALAMALSSGASADVPTTDTAKRAFVVFDGLLYKGKPDLQALGMLPIAGVNPPAVVDHDVDSVDDARVRDTLKGLRNYNGAVYLDYEQWRISGTSGAEIADSIRKLTQVAQLARSAIPNARFGFYGLLPCFDYWNVVKRVQEKIKEWKSCNARLDSLADHVDIIMPSLYTFYNDPQGWDTFAAAQLEAARRYHKPVYAFLWPEFHVSNRLLKGQNLPGNFWRHELEFCRARADGIIIWGGWQKPWDEQAPWWIETKAFLAGLNAH